MVSPSSPPKECSMIWHEKNSLHYSFSTLHSKVTNLFFFLWTRYKIIYLKLLNISLFVATLFSHRKFLKGIFLNYICSIMFNFAPSPRIMPFSDPLSSCFGKCKSTIIYWETYSIQKCCFKCLGFFFALVIERKNFSTPTLFSLPPTFVSIHLYASSLGKRSWSTFYRHWKPFYPVAFMPCWLCSL